MDYQINLRTHQRAKAFKDNRHVCLLFLFVLNLVAFSTRGNTTVHQREQSAAPGSVSASSLKVVGPTTIEELRFRIQEVLRSAQLEPAQLAIKVASLDTGRTLYEENVRKLMNPASNLKLFTIAAALDRLTPDYRFSTSAYARGRPDASGTITGDLIIYGRGDPSFSASFKDGDYQKALDELAVLIRTAGVRRVQGDLIGDESYFTGERLVPGWAWDDLQWYYGMEVSALSVNDNSVDILLKPGRRVGDACVLTTGPANLPSVEVLNHATTAQRGKKRTLHFYRRIGENHIEISGSLPADDQGYTDNLSVAHPALIFVSMLRAALERQGIVIEGITRTRDAQTRSQETVPPPALVEIAARQSPPLRIIAARTLKPSQNLYAELILRALGKADSAASTQSSSQAGIAAVQAFARKAGVDTGKLNLLDGSGLSRGNMVTVEATLQLLSYMSQHRDGSVFREALPIAGVDGTLRGRMKGTAAANNLRAKTGAIGSAVALSGYVTSGGGERLVFSMIVNNAPTDVDPRADFTDRIAVLLAAFSGHS